MHIYVNITHISICMCVCMYLKVTSDFSKTMLALKRQLYDILNVCVYIKLKSMEVKGHGNTQIVHMVKRKRKGDGKNKVLNKSWAKVCPSF